MRPAASIAVILALFATAGATAEEGSVDPGAIPTIREFLGDGVGAPHPKAPPETEQFGRLVGVWTVEAEMAGPAGDWLPSAPGIWAWKYAIDGFAVRDLFYQGADNLPPYMANLGRDYLLTANRIYDVANKTWQVAWMANGAGSVMGADFGTFTATLEDDELVMTSPPTGFGLQRVVFYEIGDDSFRWKSDYSMDEGKTWRTAMRMHARRHSASADGAGK